MPSFIGRNCIAFSLLYLKAYIGCQKYKHPGRNFPLSFYCCTVHSKIYVVHTPTNALFIKPGKVLKFTLGYTLISLLHVSVYDHHQGACTATG